MWANLDQEVSAGILPSETEYMPPTAVSLLHIQPERDGTVSVVQFFSMYVQNVSDHPLFEIGVVRRIEIIAFPSVPKITCIPIMDQLVIVAAQSKPLRAVPISLELGTHQEDADEND
jgi:hypothetical protein